MANINLGNIAMNGRGNFDATETYNRLDVVRHNNSAWAALLDDLTGADNAPNDATPQDRLNWMLLVEDSAPTANPGRSASNPDLTSLGLEGVNYDVGGTRAVKTIGFTSGPTLTTTAGVPQITDIQFNNGERTSSLSGSGNEEFALAGNDSFTVGVAPTPVFSLTGLTGDLAPLNGDWIVARAILTDDPRNVDVGSIVRLTASGFTLPASIAGIGAGRGILLTNGTHYFITSTNGSFGYFVNERPPLVNDGTNFTDWITTARVVSRINSTATSLQAGGPFGPTVSVGISSGAITFRDDANTTDLATQTVTVTLGANQFNALPVYAYTITNNELTSNNTVTGVYTGTTGHTNAQNVDSLGAAIITTANLPANNAIIPETWTYNTATDTIDTAQDADDKYTLAITASQNFGFSPSLTDAQISATEISGTSVADLLTISWTIGTETHFTTYSMPSDTEVNLALMMRIATDLAGNTFFTPTGVEVDGFPTLRLTGRANGPARVQGTATNDSPSVTLFLIRGVRAFQGGRPDVSTTTSTLSVGGTSIPVVTTDTATTLARKVAELNNLPAFFGTQLNATTARLIGIEHGPITEPAVVTTGITVTDTYTDGT